MEEKLAQYRAAKQKQYQEYRSFRERILRIISWIPFINGSKDRNSTNVISPKEYSYVEKPKEKTRLDKLLDLVPRNVLLATSAVLWTVLWYIFIQLQFGAVYFAVSLLIIMYISMRTERDTHHLSAYSVFNPNFEQIDGTFTAEQFEKELRYGPSSVH